jgi:tetratricopeptide (TPR) repeat protein
MTDNKIDISAGSDPKIDRYSSENFKKSLNLAKKLSSSESRLPKDAKYYFDLGLKKLNMEDFNMTVKYLDNPDWVNDELIQEAIDYLDRAISINPLYVDAYIVLAVVQCWMEDYTSAIDNYTQAIELDPNNSWTYYWRAHLREDIRDTIVDLDESIRVNPNNVDAYTARASAKYKLENYQGAIYDYTQLIAISPKISYYINRASAKRRIGDYQGASEDRKQEIIFKMNDCNQEIARYPNYGAYYKRAYLKRDLGDYDGYLDDIKQARILEIDSCTRRIAFDLNDFEVYQDRADAKLALGDYDGYFDDIKQARILKIDSCTRRIVLDLNDFKAYRDRADAKHELGDLQGAIDDYNQAIIVFKSTGYTQDSYQIMLTSGIYDELLAIKKHIHDKQGVIDIYTQIIALVDYSGCSRYPYCDRAEAKHNLGDYLGAIEDCNQSIKSESDIVRAYFFRASARNELGNYQEAIDDCDLAIYRYQHEPEYVRGQYFERLLSLRSQMTR